MTGADDQHRRVLTGNHAAAYACRDCRVQVVAAYPITPQSPVTERISQFVASGEMPARYVCVESEHTAITVCIGASTAGARTFTATSARPLPDARAAPLGRRGPLAHRHGLRQSGRCCPVDRLDRPSGLHEPARHGLDQIYVEDNQDIYDTIIQAYRLAERVLLPVMVCYDGYVLSHTVMPVTTLEPSAVAAFLPPYEPPLVLDPENPVNIGLVTMPIRATTIPASPSLAATWKSVIGCSGTWPPQRLRSCAWTRNLARHSASYGGRMRTHQTDDAELVILAMGTAASESRVAADYCLQGHRVGVASLRLFRPFPVTSSGTWPLKSAA